MKCTLKPEERAELLLRHTSTAAVSHFELCPACREASLQQAALWKTLDAWNVPAVSSGFNRELYARIDAALAQPWYERLGASIRPLFARPPLALALAGFAIAVGFVLDHPSTPISISHFARPHANASATAVPVSRREAEQVEKTLDDLEMLRQFDLATEEKESASKSM